MREVAARVLTGGAEFALDGGMDIKTPKAKRAAREVGAANCGMNEKTRGAKRAVRPTQTPTADLHAHTERGAHPWRQPKKETLTLESTCRNKHTRTTKHTRDGRMHRHIIGRMQTKSRTRWRMRKRKDWQSRKQTHRYTQTGCATDLHRRPQTRRTKQGT